MKKLIIIPFLMLSLSAEEIVSTEKIAKETPREIVMSKNALGVIFSSGLGSGILHRYYFADDYYVQNAGILGGYKKTNEGSFYFNYGVSIARYLHSSPESSFHVKTLVGAEFEYIETSNSYETYSSKTSTTSTTVTTLSIEKTAILDVGIGFELGSRESGNIMLSGEIMYAFEYEGKDKYSFRPSLGISALYNW